MVYLINSTYQSVCFDVYPFTVAKQWFGKPIPMAINTQTKLELSDVSFFFFAVHVVSKEGLWVCLCVCVCPPPNPHHC
jgi:hypothetical protein